MRELPLVLQGAEVRALLAGTKKRVTRPVTLREFKPYVHPTWDWTFRHKRLWAEYYTTVGLVHERSPLGAPGDYLWVRETVRFNAEHDNFYYTADAKGVGEDRFLRWKKCWKNRKIIPSTHMPIWASRITLQVTEVRVQRLQEITEREAKAEGFEPVTTSRKIYPSKHAANVPYQSYLSGFIKSWDKRYRKTYPWASNPYVWVAEFEKLP